MKAAVIGSINMDMTVQTERIPKKGETLKGTDLRYVPGGKGANQAVAMSRLGAQVEMFGCIGEDDWGRRLTDNLKRNGVGTSHIKTIGDAPTGIALITIGENDNTIIVVSGANDRVSPRYVDSIKEELKEFDIVILQHEIPQETVDYIICFCHENGIKVILNPAPARAVKQEMIDKIDYLTPNEHEAAILFGGASSLDEILKKYPEKLIITQGSKGVSFCTRDGKIRTVPARKSEVKDTTGAGDTLNAAFAVQVAMGASVGDALVFANTAAGLSTESFGAQGGMPSYESVVAAMKGSSTI